jgi:hypothetical protein
MRLIELLEGTRCWKGYEKKGMKTMFGKRVPNCVKKEDIDPEGPEVTIGDYTTTHFFMCGSAIETAEKHADKPGMERLIRLQDMVYKLEKAVMDDESTQEAKDLAYKLHDAVMDQAREIGIEEEVADYQESHLNSIVKGDPEPGFGRVDLKEEYKGGLRKWFGQKWVNIGKKKKGGGHPECGTSGDKRGYAKCVPASKAASMSKKEKESATRRKRSAQNKAGRGGKNQKGQGNKPIRVSTSKKK